MANLIELRDISLSRNSKRTVLRYRKLMFRSLAASLDNIRLRSTDYIRPNTSGSKNLRQMYKDQPSVPGQLTSRTGLLIIMLKAKARFNEHVGWKITSQMARLKTDALAGRVSLAGGAGTAHEFYKAILKVQISNSSKLASFVQNAIPSARKWTKKGNFSTQKLAMRFQHETGIRGQKRQFIEPATKQERFTTDRLVKRKLSQLNRSFN